MLSGDGDGAVDESATGYGGPLAAALGFAVAESGARRRASSSPINKC